MAKPILRSKHKRHAKRVVIHSGHQIVIQVPIVVTGTLNLQVPYGELGQIVTIGAMILVAVEFVGRKLHWFK